MNPAKSVTAEPKDQTKVKGMPDAQQVSEYFTEKPNRRGTTNLIGKTTKNKSLGDFESEVLRRDGQFQLRCTNRRKDPKCNAKLIVSNDRRFFNLVNSHACRWKIAGVDIEYSESSISDDNEEDLPEAEIQIMKGTQHTTTNKDSLLFNAYWQSKGLNQSQNQTNAASIDNDPKSLNISQQTIVQQGTPQGQFITQGGGMPQATHQIIRPNTWSISNQSAFSQRSSSLTRHGNEQSLYGNSQQRLPAISPSNMLLCGQTPTQKTITLTDLQGVQKKAILFDFALLDSFIEKLLQLQMSNKLAYVKDVQKLLRETADGLDVENQTPKPSEAPVNQVMMMETGNGTLSRQKLVGEKMGETLDGQKNKTFKKREGKTTTQQQSETTQKSKSNSNKDKEEEKSTRRNFATESIEEMSDIEVDQGDEHGCKASDEVKKSRKQIKTNQQKTTNKILTVEGRTVRDEGVGIVAAPDMPHMKDSSREEIDSAFFNDDYLKDMHQDFNKILDQLGFVGITVYSSFVVDNKDSNVELMTVVKNIWRASLFDEARSYVAVDLNVKLQILYECLSDKLADFISGVTEVVAGWKTKGNFKDKFPVKIQNALGYNEATQRFMMNIKTSYELMRWSLLNMNVLEPRFKSPYYASLKEGWVSKIKTLRQSGFDASKVDEAYRIMREHEPEKTK